MNRVLTILASAVLVLWLGLSVIEAPHSAQLGWRSRKVSHPSAVLLAGGGALITGVARTGSGTPIGVGVILVGAGFISAGTR